MANSDVAHRAMTLRAFLEGAAAHGARISTRRLSDEGARREMLEELPAEAALFYLASASDDELARIVEYTELTELYRSRNAVGHIAASEDADRYWFWLEESVGSSEDE